jgi:REP element-mobilizing transposase RayT
MRAKNYEMSKPRRIHDPGDPSRLTRQLSLELKTGKRGGARPGAGRPRVKDADRGFIAHTARPSHRKGDPVHVTLRVKSGIPSLRRQAMERIVKRALVKQREKLTEEGRKHFQVVHFTIQSDHLHLIVEAPDKRGLARGVAGLEIRIARRLNKLLQRKGAFWKERYHRRDLRTPTETRNALRYVLMNTQKHYRVIGDRNFADPYSSAATFDGFTRSPATFEDANPWQWVKPRTWLLGVGWRRHALLDPADAPSREDTKPSRRNPRPRRIPQRPAS